MIAVLRISVALGLLAFTLPVVPVHAQSRGGGHGFSHTNPGALALGLYGGVEGVFATGGPAPSCNCSYDGGTGSGLHAGFVADVRVAPEGAIRLTIGSSMQNSVYTADVLRQGYRLDGSAVSVTAEHRTEVEPNYLTTGASFVWYSGLGNLYVLGGASAWFFLDGTIKETETITTAGLVFDTGSNTMVFEDGDLGDAEAMNTQVGVTVGTGWDIPIARWMAVAPEVSVTYPFTQTAGTSSDWRMATLRGTIVVRFGL